MFLSGILPSCSCCIHEIHLPQFLRCKLCEEVIIVDTGCYFFTWWTKESVHPALLPPQLSLVFNNLQFWNVLFTCCNHNWDTLTWSLLKCLSCCISIFSRGPQTSQKSKSHLQFPGARGLTCSKLHTKHPQFQSDPWLSALWHFLLGACVVIHILACKEKREVIMLKIFIRNFL